MPLVMLCEAGHKVFVKQMQEDRKYFIFVYDCPTCGLIDHRELIDKLSW